MGKGEKKWREREREGPVPFRKFLDPPLKALPVEGVDNSLWQTPKKQGGN